MDIEKVEPVIINSQSVSSSVIRDLVKEGKMEEANRFLGHPFFCTGKVIAGEKIGRKIGFPTANINIEESYKLLPKNGVYAVHTEIDNRKYYGMCNIGFRPTVHSQKDISVEVNIFDFTNDIYDKQLKVDFLVRIRDEKKFKDINQLIAQLNRDKKEISGIFKTKYKI